MLWGSPSQQGPAGQRREGEAGTAMKGATWTTLRSLAEPGHRSLCPQQGCGERGEGGVREGSLPGMQAQVGFYRAGVKSQGQGCGGRPWRRQWGVGPGTPRPCLLIASRWGYHVSKHSHWGTRSLGTRQMASGEWGWAGTRGLSHSGEGLAGPQALQAYPPPGLSSCLTGGSLRPSGSPTDSGVRPGLLGRGAKGARGAWDTQFLTPARCQPAPQAPHSPWSLGARPEL